MEEDHVGLTISMSGKSRAMGGGAARGGGGTICRFVRAAKFMEKLDEWGIAIG